MSKTIEFYNVAIYKNQAKTSLSFLKFIDQIPLIADRRNVVRRIDDKTSAIFPFHFSSNINMRIIPFGKFRDNYKPYIGDIGTTNLTPINKDVVEVTTMLYDHTYRTVVLEYNNNGLKRKDIEKYLSTFIDGQGNDIWEVRLSPVVSHKNRDELNNSPQIRSIELKLKLDIVSERIIKQGVEVQENSLLNFFRSLGTVNEDLEANILKLEFGVGNSKVATMKLETIRYLLATLNIDDDCIEGFRVKYRDNRTEKLDMFDFKNADPVLKDILFPNNEVQNPASEQIGQNMIEIYPQHEGTLIRSYTQFTENMVQCEIPRLKRIPDPINFVQLVEQEEVVNG